MGSEIHTGGHKLGYAEYAAIPDDGKRHEVLDGVHYVSPAPSVEHQRVSARLLQCLMAQVNDAGLGEVLCAPVDVELDEHTIVQPDLVVILERNSGIVIPSRIRGVPELLVEILSPSNRAHDTVRKKAWYEAHAVPEYWVVDPVQQCVDVFVLDGGCYGAPERAVSRLAMRADPRVALDLTRVWAAPSDG